MEQEKKYTVYMHTNKINNKAYIGITSYQVEKRWANGSGYKKQPYFYNAIQKYGWDNFEHTVFMTDLTKEYACYIEKLLIALFDTTNRDKGYNIQPGGEIGNLGIPMSEEAKKKLSEAKKGCKPAMETRLKLRETQIKWWTEERRMCKREECLKDKNPMFGIHRYGEENPFYGKTHTDEARSKMSVSQKKRFENPEEKMKISERAKERLKNLENHPFFGKHHSMEAIEKMRHKSSCKLVLCVETNLIYYSTKEAGRQTGIDPTSIAKCCRGKQRTCGGYHWQYISEEEVSA